MSHDNSAHLPTTHPQVLELCIVLGKCLRGIALVTHPSTPITNTTQPHSELKFVSAVSAGGSVKFLLAV